MVQTTLSASIRLATLANYYVCKYPAGPGVQLFGCVQVSGWPLCLRPWALRQPLASATEWLLSREAGLDSECLGAGSS